MMKLKALKKFHDKETDEMRNVGDVFEVSDERGKVILESRYNVAELLEVGEPDGSENGSDGEPTAGGNEPPTDGEDLEKLSVEELKAKAEEMGIDTTKLKKKKDFIKALKK